MKSQEVLSKVIIEEFLAKEGVNDWLSKRRQNADFIVGSLLEAHRRFYDMNEKDTVSSVYVMESLKALIKLEYEIVQKATQFGDDYKDLLLTFLADTILKSYSAAPDDRRNA